MKQSLGVGAIVFALTMMIFGFTQADAQGAADDPAKVEAGKAVFTTNCAGCHGAAGEGVQGRGRPLVGVAAQQADRAVHIKSVTDGKGAMPGFGTKLKAEEIDAAVTYVRLTFVEAAADDAAAEEEEAAADEEEAPAALAATGAETPFLAIAGLAMLGAGTALVIYGRREI